MSDITPFLFEGTNVVRTLDRKRDPWFVAVDVCRCLEIKNSSDAISVLDSDEKGVALTDTLGGQQEVAIISEGGLYTLILRSRKAMTPGTIQHRFRKWVTSEVIPAIRKTGGYGTQRLDIAGHHLAVSLMYRIKKETCPTIRASLHGLLAQAMTALGQEIPPLDGIGRERPRPSDLAETFWQAVADLQAAGAVIDHARDIDRLALHLPTLRDVHGLASPWNVRAALKRDPRFIAVKTVNSGLIGRAIKCWVFHQPSRG